MVLSVSLVMLDMARAGGRHAGGDVARGRASEAARPRAASGAARGDTRRGLRRRGGGGRDQVDGPRDRGPPPPHQIGAGPRALLVGAGDRAPL
jgi:hypothetical protein